MALYIQWPAAALPYIRSASSPIPFVFLRSRSLASYPRTRNGFLCRAYCPRVAISLSLSLSLSLSRRGECARVAHFLAPNKHTRVRPTAWTSSWIYVVFCIRHFPSTRIWYTYVRMCVCRQGRHSRLIISSARALTLNFENLFGNYWPSLSD